MPKVQQWEAGAVSWRRQLTAPSTSAPRTTMRFPPSALMRPLSCQPRWNSRGAYHPYCSNSPVAWGSCVSVRSSGKSSSLTGRSVTCSGMARSCHGPAHGGCQPSLPWSAPCLRPGRAAGLLGHGVQELAAGLLAGPAGLLANPAVLVVPGVPLALVAAVLADGYAGLQQWPSDVEVICRLAAHHRDGGAADIGAVQAQPDTRDHLGQVLLAQVGVDVGDAGLCAVAERVDGGCQQVGVDADGAWVGVQQLPRVAHGPSF